jgi:hypothetical protein
MSKAELLTCLINQMIDSIIGNSLNPDDILDRLRENKFYLGSINMLVQTNVNCLNFYADRPEDEHLNNSVTTYEAKEFFRITLNEIYHNDQMSEQINE